MVHGWHRRRSLMIPPDDHRIDRTTPRPRLGERRRPGFRTVPHSLSARPRYTVTSDRIGPGGRIGRCTELGPQFSKRPGRRY
eukprot:762679-Hanusia_phi.AAC.1